MHNVHIETSEYPFDHPPVTWYAVCNDCGFVSHDCDSPGEAWQEGLDHDD